MIENKNWLGLTEKQLEAGLVERGHVTMNLRTGQKNSHVIPGAVAAIESLSEILRPAFQTWWKTGSVPDVSEPGGLNLQKMVNGENGLKHSVIGAFVSMDLVLKTPAARGVVSKGFHDTFTSSSTR